MTREQAEQQFETNAAIIDSIAKAIGPTSVTSLAKLCEVHRDTIVKHWSHGSTRKGRGPAPDKRASLEQKIKHHLPELNGEMIADKLRMIADQLDPHGAHTGRQTKNGPCQLG